MVISIKKPKITNVNPIIPPMTVKIIEPMRPSHDFLGLIFGARGCFPKSTPTKYPREEGISLHTK